MFIFNKDKKKMKLAKELALKATKMEEDFINECLLVNGLPSNSIKTGNVQINEICNQVKVYYDSHLIGIYNKPIINWHDKTVVMSKKVNKIYVNNKAN